MKKMFLVIVIFPICQQTFIMKCILLVLVSVASSLAWPAFHQDPLQDPNWKDWKEFHGKKYGDNGEERVRHFIWQDNLKKIIAHNDEGQKYKLAMNHLGDFVSHRNSRICIIFFLACNLQWKD